MFSILNVAITKAVILEWLYIQIHSNLTLLGRVTHICVAYLTTIASDNGLSPSRHQAIIWTNAGILLIRPIGTNFNFNRNSLIFIQENAFKDVICEKAAILSRPQCVKYFWNPVFLICWKRKVAVDSYIRVPKNWTVSDMTATT